MLPSTFPRDGTGNMTLSHVGIFCEAVNIMTAAELDAAYKRLLSLGPSELETMLCM